MLDRNRRPWVISLALSGLAHLAVLAWVVVDVPELGDNGRVMDRSGPLAADEAPEQRVVQVIRIQPPGLLRSGGSGGGKSQGGGVNESGSTTIVAPLAKPQSPRGSLTLSPAQPIAMTLVAPDGPSPAVVLAELAAARKPSDRSARPNRGLLLKSGSSGDRPASGRSGFGGAGRSGIGLGGSGATSIGIGTDCITAGTATPAGRLPIIGAAGPRGIGGRGAATGRGGRP